MTQVLDILHDTRINCYSVLVTLPMTEYLEMVKPIYSRKDVLEKQRSALRTTSAKKIRARMVEDLSKGSVLPPVVIGVVLEKNKLDTLAQKTYDEFMSEIRGVSDDNKAIVDGMQRTTAMIEVHSQSGNANVINNAKTRIEFWIADNINSLIYRMLVLNTGQVPWDLRRQVEVVFDPVITELKNSTSEISIIEIHDASKRTQAGEYQANAIVELFLAFGLRTHKIDIKEEIANEFSRLDFIEATGNQEFLKDFKIALNYLAKFDKYFSKYIGNGGIADSRIKKGLDIFSMQTARIGFIVAFAREVFGRPGIDRTPEDVIKRLSKVQKNLNCLIEKINDYDTHQIGSFLELDILNEILSSSKKGSIGEWDREFFLVAFEDMIKNADDIEYLSSCWRAS